MEKSLIWVINSERESQFVDIEVFEGRNKYTKSGLFSGPLRRLNLEKESDYEKTYGMIPIENITQIGKNKFRIYKKDIWVLCEEWKAKQLDSVYCRLEDKKLHHISTFTGKVGGTEQESFLYDSKKKELIYKALTEEKSQDHHIATVPETKLYLYQADGKIKSHLTFVYQGVELPTNCKQEIIAINDETSFRNLQYEQKIKGDLVAVGGHRSLNSEIVFSQRDFFSKILPCLCKMNIRLFWGEDKKPVSKSSFSCRISYDIEWFSLSGSVQGQNEIYKLSDLLRVSKGKNYVEIDNGILFIPEELKKVALYSNADGQVQIPLKKMADVNAVAERFNLDPSIYLKKFSEDMKSKCQIKPELNAILKPYQKDGVAWLDSMYQRGFGCCLADDMGLGKTLQTIVFLSGRRLKANAPVLIVVPKIVLYNWGKEIQSFMPEQKYIFVYDKFDYSSTVQNDQWYLTTYETLINHEEYFRSINYDTVVLDEAHYIKNYKTKRYEAIENLNAEFILALTGTPIENNIEELWALLYMMNPGLFGKHADFMKKFSDIHENEKKMEQMKKIIAPFVLRRTKGQVLKELPQKTERYIYCNMGPEQKKIYETLLTATQNELREKPSRYIIKDNAAILQALLYLRELCTDPDLLPPGMGETDDCGSCKFELFKDYAECVISENGKLIIYSLFPKALQRLKQWCDQRGWNTYYIDGTTNNRQEIVDKFEQQPTGLFFISLKAGGVGLSLVSCQYVIIYDPWWNSAVEQQAADRVYRIGQEKPVFIYHFLVKDSIEEKIYELQKKKKILSETILDKSGVIEKLSMEDLYQLLF